MRHPLGDFVESRQRVFDPRFMGDRDHVKQSVGGSAHRHIECYRVVDCVGGNDVAKADAATEEL
jgi:hypothetical protein